MRARNPKPNGPTKQPSAPSRSLRQSAPSFASLCASSTAASCSMRGNRSSDTKPELLLRRALWKAGARYTVANRDLPGRPDIAFRRHRIAVFCDGDFWHGRLWVKRRAALKRGANADYWIRKISYNIGRDKANTRQLRRLGWVVVRVWESELVVSTDRLANRIMRLVRREPQGPHTA